MVVWTVLLAAALTAQIDAKPRPTGPRFDPNEPAAEAVALRDGSTILGLITAAPRSTKGVRPLRMIVRRAWAEAHQKDRLAAWDRAAGPAARRTAGLEIDRLARWRRDRTAALPADQIRTDRIIRWIDQRTERLQAPDGGGRAPLLVVEIARGTVRSIESRPAAVARLLATAWLCGVPEPETMTAGQVQDAVEGRGVIIDVSRPAALDDLLPPAAETEDRWLVRRAATEVAVDPGVRFIRFQDLVLPDSKDRRALDQIGLASGLSELQNLIDPGRNQTDPLVERFTKIEAAGGVGARVTALTIAPDLASTTVEITLWVRAGPKRWLPAGSQSATVRPDDLQPAAGDDLAGDPSIQSAFQIIEGLGFGRIAQEMKQRSLRLGAAVQKALGLARSAFEPELDALAFPIFNPAGAEADGPASGAANPPVDGQPRERPIEREP